MDIPIAYTSSPLLQRTTTSIDTLRIRALTTPLRFNKELTLRSQCTHERILMALKLARIPMTSVELNRLLLASPKRPHPIEKEALLYRQALSYIRDEWTGQPTPITLPHIEVLTHISLRHSFSRISRIIEENSTDLLRLLAYIEASNDHPVLLSGIIYAAMMHTNLHSFSQGRTTLLLTNLMMAKTGYDIRGMLSFESTLLADSKSYRHALASITSYGQMTIWLEYFATAVLAAYKKIAMQIDIIKKQSDTASPITLLNERQKHILLLLDAIGTKVTNREIQKRFRISQITASRDLTKLVFAGYLVSRGKGRSVSYSLA